MSKSFIALAIIFLVAVLISIPLIKPGLYIIHDDQQIARLFLFDEALKTGQFPVRWVDDLGFGFGYPLFVFYPPLVYMLGEIFHLIGFGFIDSVKLVFSLSIFASGITMYIFAKELFGKLVGVISALFYMLVPYRAIDVFIRGALAESFSFVWLPLILWSLYRLQRTEKTLYIYTSAIFLALLMITHNLIFLPFMLILPFYLFFLILVSVNKKKFIVNCFWSIVASLGLSAFFWIPAILEKKFTIVDQLLLVNLANYNSHFVYPQQLWNSLWGFGGSAAGLADGISFKIGKLHVLVSVAAFLMAIIHLFKIRSKKFPVSSFQFPVLMFGLFLLSAFMTTFYSKPIWDLILPLGYLQFPWRFLTFTALFSSILAGASVYLLRLPILKLIASLILAVLLVVGNFKLFKPQTYRLDLTDKIATSKETINWDISQSSFEYIPKGIDLKKSELGTSTVNITKSEVPMQKVEIVSGQAQITDLKTTPSQVKFIFDAKEESQVKINVFNFPGWQVKIDQSRIPIDNNNRLKLMSFDAPKGIHQVEVEFMNTPIRTVANAITVSSIIVIVFFILRPKWRSFLTSQEEFSTRFAKASARRAGSNNNQT